MMDATTLELETLLNRFVDGADTSLAAANRLELLLSDLFPDDEVVNERVGDLAQYRSGGGESFSSMQSKCAPASAASAAIWR